MTSIERVFTAISLKEPDRVPIWMLIDFLPVKYYDITAKEIIEDPVKSQKAYEWLYLELGGFDFGLPGGGIYFQFINVFPDTYSAYYLDWRLPGRMLSEYASPQLFERSHNNPVLKETDYNRLIDDGFFWLLNFNRASRKDSRILGKVAKKVTKNIEKWWNYYKTPTIAEGGATIPFELLSFFRGSTNFMKDIYRYPEKIKEVSDFIIDGLIAVGEYGPMMSGGKTIIVGATRCSADFISEKHFEDLVFPYLKKMVETFLKDGFIVQLHFDTNWTPRLHYLEGLPKGNIYLHIDERTDIFKAKEILGDHMCIEGNLKPSLFSLGSPHQIEEHVKKIINECADGGGLMVGSEIPDNAKMENVKALVDTCKNYGIYRK